MTTATSNRAGLAHNRIASASSSATLKGAFAITIRGIAALIVLITTLVAEPVHAGYAVGKVTQVLVGRLGTQVYIGVAAPQFVDWPCASTHPSGFRYAFVLSQSAAREMLATILTAQATGKNLQVVGAGTCTVDATMEDISYVVLQP
jgi:hypothetical protein